MRRELTPERFATLAETRRLPIVVQWGYRITGDDFGHAVIHPPRPGLPAVGLNWDGYEYLVGCGVRAQPDGTTEHWTDGELRYLRSQDGKWHRPEVETATNHAADARAIGAWHGRQIVENAQTWLGGVRRWHLYRDAPAPPSWLLLHGRPGCGKTTMARWLHRELASVAVIATWARWTDHLGACREAANGRRPVIGGPVIVLDDIGADGGTAFGAECLYEVLDHAEASGQIVVCTSNLNLEGLKAQYGKTDAGSGNAERAVSRLARRAIPVALTGKRGA